MGFVADLVQRKRDDVVSGGHRVHADDGGQAPRPCRDRLRPGRRVGRAADYQQLDQRLENRRARSRRVGTDHTPVSVEVDGVLKQASLSIPLNAKQAIVVTSGATDATRGELRLLEKSDAGWAIRLGPFDVALGSKGMRRGVDIVPNDIAPQKKEGDLTSPWGVFAIGSAFGTKPKKKAWTWRYRAVQSDDVWVDDPQSKFYNTWQKNGGAWRSAEALTQYDRALVIEHNTTFPRAGAGSAIFLHSWSDVDQPTLGCTALRQKDLDKVLGLLTEKRHPVFVQAPVWWIAPAKN